MERVTPPASIRRMKVQVESHGPHLTLRKLATDEAFAAKKKPGSTAELPLISLPSEIRSVPSNNGRCRTAKPIIDTHSSHVIHDLMFMQIREIKCGLEGATAGVLA